MREIFTLEDGYNASFQGFDYCGYHSQYPDLLFKDKQCNTYVGGTYEALTQAQPDISGQTVYDKDTQTTNQFVIAQDNSGNVTMAQWVPMAFILSNAGDPNGAVAGNVNYLCYDTVGMALYICTASGSISTATWQAI